MIQDTINRMAQTTGLSIQDAMNEINNSSGLSFQEALYAYCNSSGLTVAVTDSIQDLFNTLNNSTALTVDEVSDILYDFNFYRNINWATGDTAITSDGWVESVENGWYFDNIATSCSCEFDSAETRTGKYTLKINATDASGRGRAGNTETLTNTDPDPSESPFFIKVDPSTEYIFSCYAKTTDVGNNGVYVLFYADDASGTYLSETYFTNKLAGTNAWTELTKTFTTHADCQYLRTNFRNDVAGTISSAWFDVNSMTLKKT